MNRLSSAFPKVFENFWVTFGPDYSRPLSGDGMGAFLKSMAAICTKVSIWQLVEMHRRSTPRPSSRSAIAFIAANGI